MYRTPDSAKCRPEKSGYLQGNGQVAEIINTSHGSRQGRIRKKDRLTSRANDSVGSDFFFSLKPFTFSRGPTASGTMRLSEELEGTPRCFHFWNRIEVERTVYGIVRDSNIPGRIYTA